jgi:hypothetical protein
MRESNPRGREPNPLSKSALVRSPPSLSVRSSVDRRRFVADERQRTFPTETRTETTLMIKLPMVTRPAMPRDWESRTASGPDFASVPCISAGDRALVETGLHLCRMPLPHRSGLRSGLAGLQPIVARLRWDQTASPRTHGARCTQSRPIPQSGPKQAASQDAYQHCPPGRCDEDAAPRTVPRRQAFRQVQKAIMTPLLRSMRGS